MTNHAATIRSGNTLAAVMVLMALVLGVAPAAGAVGQPFDAILDQLTALNAKADAVQANLAAVQTRLDQLEGSLAQQADFGMQLCGEVALSLNGSYGIGGEGSVKLRGSAGANAYGNGVTVMPEGRPRTRLEGTVLGELGLRQTLCFDPRRLAQAIADGTYQGPPLSAATQVHLQNIVAIDQGALAAKLLESAAATSMDPAAMTAALDEVPLLSGAFDPLALFNDPQNDLVKIANAVPLPPGVKAKLLNVGTEVVGVFNALQKPCNLTLPSPIGDVLDDICFVASGEPLGPAIAAINTTVTTIKNSTLVGIGNAVNAVKGVVDSIKSAVCSIPGVPC